MTIPYLCIALLGLLVFIGGFYVSICRRKASMGSGHPDDPSHFLHKAVRAHGNTIEFAPMIALLIYILAQFQLPMWVLACMVLATLGRYSIFFGLILSPTIAKPHPLRFVGSLSSYIFGTVLSAYLLYSILV